MAALISHTTTPSPPTHANPAGACPLTLPCGTLLWLLPGRAVWWPQARSLFVADVHFGKAASFRHAGQPVPTGTTADNIARLDALLTTTGAQRLVFWATFCMHAAARNPPCGSNCAPGGRGTRKWPWTWCWATMTAMRAPRPLT